MSEKSIYLPLQNIEVNANTLKIIAIVAMFVDHFSRLVTEFGSSERWIAHLAGRLAAPLICFLIAEGHHYTSNKKRYIFRLFIFAIVSHVPYNLYFGLGMFSATSVMWTLMLGVIALAVITKEDWNVLVRMTLLGMLFIFSMPANWHYIGVLWIIVFGLFREYPKLKVVIFVLVALVFYILPGLQDVGLYASYRFGVLLTIPFFWWYNNKPGMRNAFTKWGFYWFYPFHLLLLFAVRLLMG